MHRDRPTPTKSTIFLITLLEAGKLMYNIKSIGSLKRAVAPELFANYRDEAFKQIYYRLIKKGLLKVEYKNSKRIVKLTKHGELEALFQKSLITPNTTKNPDGSWTIFSFDIPERARIIRSQLRKLLSTYGFKPLQASVYVHPGQFPQAGMDHLKSTGLDKYICVFQASKISGKRELKDLFKP